MKQLPITQSNPSPGMIDLGSGNPDPDLLPIGTLKTAAERYFKSCDPRTLQYGAEQGNGNFLGTLSGFLSPRYGFEVDPSSLLITSGASSALDLLCTLFTRAGDVVFVEEPSYFLALRIFADHRLKVVSLPVDDSGLQVGVVQDLFGKYRPQFIYTVPTFQNPSGCSLSMDRRKKLVQLAQEHDFLVIADEVYHLLGYAKAPPAPFASFSKDVAQVISINSFSKILAPGLRLGWIQAHEKIVKALAGCGLLDSGGGMNPFTSAIVDEYIESGDLDRNIHNLKLAYSTRLNALTAALDRYIPGAEYYRPEGGFFVWVRLPGVDASKLRPRAKEAGVDFRPGALFSSRDGLSEYIRLGFCYYSPNEIKEGVSRLGNCL